MSNLPVRIIIARDVKVYHVYRSSVTRFTAKQSSIHRVHECNTNMGVARTLYGVASFGNFPIFRISTHQEVRGSGVCMCVAHW